MKYSVCLEFFFKDLPVEERLAKVKEQGFDAGELWFWRGRDVAALRRAADDNAFEISSICAMEPIPGFNDVEKRQKIHRGVLESLDAAAALDCKRLIVMGGTSLDGIDRGEQLRHAAEGLAVAAEEAASRGLILTLELLNSKKDFPGYLIDNTRDLLAIVKEVASPGLAVVWDCYHTGMMEQDQLTTIRENLNWIEGFQIAAVPTRDEPTSGEVDYRALVGLLDERHFDGYVCFEYAPKIADSAESLQSSLAWLTG